MQTILTWQFTTAINAINYAINSHLEIYFLTWAFTVIINAIDYAITSHLQISAPQSLSTANWGTWNLALGVRQAPHRVGFYQITRNKTFDPP